MAEELGDLLLQIVFHCQLAKERSAFDFEKVARHVTDKLIRRHPHVFADVEVSGAGEVLKNWELIKAAEKKDRGLLESVPRSLPALTRAQRVGEKVERVGFDWPDAHGSRAKVTEEMGELDRAIAEGDKSRIEGELGDVLFALVNLARHVDVDAEGALRRTIEKFQRRFEHVETRVKERHGGWPAPSDAGQSKLRLEELDRYWDEAKQRE
jgi:tetrapyrrole methylase family protein/MazG family protein/ATP diphosphatase